MFRDASEELARLEAELLAAEEADEDTGEEYYDSEEEDPDEYSAADYEEEYDEADDSADYTGRFTAYNTDQTDEDLESYADAVRTPKKSGCMPFLIVLLCLLTVSVVALVILILRQRGLL